MFQAVVDKHRANRDELSSQADHLEKSATAAADKFSSLIVDDLNEEVKQIYDTQKVLERESQLLKQELAALTQQLTTWSSKTQELLETLKHVGDLEHYISVLDQEAAAIAKVLTAAATSNQAPEPASGSPVEHLSVDTSSAATGDSENKADTDTTLSGPLSPAAVAAATARDNTLSSPSQRDSVVASSSSKASPGPAAVAEAHSGPEAECAEAAEAVAGDSQPTLAQLPVSSRASR